jgi:hypothetical protein
MKGAGTLALCALVAATAVLPGCKRRPAGASLGDAGAGASAAEGRRRLSPSEADTALSGAAAAFQSPQRDCNKILETIEGAWSFADEMTTQRRALRAGALCAEQVHNYALMLGMSKTLAQQDPSSLRLALVPRALMGMHRTKDATTALADLHKRWPNEPRVLYTGAQLALSEHDWPSVLALADQTAKAMKGDTDPDVAPLVWGVELLREAGYVFTGELAKAQASIDAAAKAGAPQTVVDEVKREVLAMKANKVGVDADVPREVFLGTYHLSGKEDGVPDVFHVALVNSTGQDQLLKVEMEIPGVTEKATKTVALSTGKSADVSFTPPLRSDFKPADVVASRSEQVNVKVSIEGDKEKVVYDDSESLTIYPRDVISWAGPVDLIAAWVTPQAPGMEEFMTAAKKRAPRGALPGSLGATVPQVKAIYDELKARGFSYVLVNSLGAASLQPVRLPEQSLKSTNALCIDGAVLFASLMEKIGLKPFVVIIPGHAFVGWHAEAADRQPPGTDYFLETTVVKSYPFESAMSLALKEIEREKAKKHFDNGASHIVDIAAMRAAGIAPQPWD